MAWKFRLLWNESSGEIFLAVSDSKQDSETVIPIPADKGMDAFRHPFAYLHASQVIPTPWRRSMNYNADNDRKSFKVLLRLQLLPIVRNLGRGFGSG